MFVGCMDIYIGERAIIVRLICFVKQPTDWIELVNEEDPAQD
jgi:hypothetical protein